MSQFNKVGVLLGDPVRLTVDASALRRSLDYLGEWCDDSASRITLLQAKSQQDSTSIQQLSTHLNSLDPVLSQCISRLDSLDKLQSRVDSWSSRFTALEEKSLTLQSEVYQRLADMQKDIDVLKIDCGAEIDKAEKVILREVGKKITVLTTEFENRLEGVRFSQAELTRERIQEAENNILQKLERRLLRPNEEQEGESGDPLEGFGRKIQSISDEFKAMNARMLNLERRAAKEKTENRSFRSLSKAMQDPDDFAHEAHLKLVTILTEINDVKESFKLLANTSPDLLQPEGIPNFSNYVPYMSRLTDLEQRLSLLPGRDELEKLMSEVSNIKGLLEDVESPILRTPTGLQSAGLAEILQEIGTLKRQVSETKVRGSKIALFPTRDVLDIFPEIPKSEVEVFRDIPLVSPVDNNTEMLKQAILTLQKSVAMKASKSEVEALFASLRLRGGAAGFDINVGSEGVGGVNDRLETLSHSIDTLRKELDSQQKALKSLDDHITTKDILHQENLTRFQSEITYQFQELYTKINTSADDPESIKSITGLKLVLMKLQKDLKDMKNDTEARRSSVYFSSKPPSNEETPREKDDNFRDLVLKHETLLKQLSVQIAKIYADFEETQVQIQRQNENLLSGSLKQMEELRNYVSSMMEKVSQGAKLSQNDLEKLNDVMSMLENKGDKAEIKTKVDKMELKRTHRILSKRIESLQGELKRTEALQQVPPTRDEALLIRTKLDHECLACGQEVPVFQWRREWQSRGKFPETKFRLGPGFSKILPVLKELSDVYMTQKVHQRTSSDGRFTPNVMERTYTPVGVNVPGTERAAHRVMTSNPGMRALHRRKESSGV